jgi:hypothetical protein
MIFHYSYYFSINLVDWNSFSYLLCLFFIGSELDWLGVIKTMQEFQTSIWMNITINESSFYLTEILRDQKMYWNTRFIPWYGWEASFQDK